MSSTTERTPDGYEELDEVEKQKVRDLIWRVAAESDPLARMAILDEALTSGSSSARLAQ
jgi:hypothetical protein